MGSFPLTALTLNASVLVVEDAADAPLILGDAITPAEVALLREGGWCTGEADRRSQ